jgi:hypothetical protein
VILAASRPKGMPRPNGSERSEALRCRTRLTASQELHTFEGQCPRLLRRRNNASRGAGLRMYPCPWHNRTREAYMTLSEGMGVSALRIAYSSL